MRKTLKSAGAAALAAATVVSGLSFGSAAATAAPKMETNAAAEVKLVFQTGPNAFVTNIQPYDVGNNRSYYGTYSTLESALARTHTYQVERLNDGWLRLRLSSSCLVAFTWALAGQPAMHPHPDCSSTASQWRLTNGKLENRASGLVGKTFSYVAFTDGGRVSHLGFTGQTGGWQLAGDLSPLNPVTNGGVAAATNPATPLNRTGSGAVPFAMRATSSYNRITSSTVTFTAPANTVFTPGQTVRGQWRTSASAAWNLDAGLNLKNVSITNNGRTMSGTFTSPSGFEQPTNHELGWLPMVTPNADAPTGQSTMTATATGSTNLGAFTVNGSTATTITDNGGFDVGGVGQAATIKRDQLIDVSFGMKAHTQVHLKGATSITVTAPTGTRFPTDLTSLTGAYKTPGGSWVASPNINVTGSVSEDGRTFTGTIPADAPHAAFQVNAEGRWTGKLKGDANALGGTRNLGFTVAGETNAGAFSVAGNSAITIDAPVHDNGGYAAAGVGHPATVLGGQEVDAYVGLKSEAAVTAMNDTNVTLTAPAGTTFVAGQTTLNGQFKEPDADWTSTSNLRVTGTVSADGRTFTGAIPNTTSSFKMLEDYQARWGIKLTAQVSAADGSGNLAFTIAGATNVGAFTVNGNSAITIKKTTTALTATVGKIDNVKKEAVISGKATANAEIKRGSTVIATADDSGDWSATLTDLSVGENTIALEQHVNGVKIDEKSATVTILTILTNGNGPDAVLKRGGDKQVFAHVNVNEAFNNVADGKVTFTAPAGTTFKAGQTTTDGQWKLGDGAWTASTNLALTNGKLTDDGTKFTFDWTSSPAGTFQKDYLLRWSLQVSTPATGDAINSTLGYSVTGSSNKGTFAATGTTKTTADEARANGGFDTAGVGSAASVKQGKQTDVSFGMTADQDQIRLDGATQVTVTAPAGTTFPADLTKLTGQYKSASTGLVPSPNIDVTGTVSPDGKKFTGTIPADTSAVFRAGSEGLWTGKLNAAPDAALGTRDLGFTVTGATQLGSFSVTGNSAITVEKSDIVDLTARGAFDDEDVTKLATISGDAQAGATVKLHDADGKVIDTTTANGDNRYSFDVPAPKVGGEHKFAVTQTPSGEAESAPVNVELDYGTNTGLEVTSPVNGSTFTDAVPTFAGNGQTGAHVDVRGTTRVIGYGSVVDGKWSFPAGFSLQEGFYSVKAVQTTKGGLQTTKDLTFTIAKKDETIGLTAKAAFDADDATKPALVTGAATPGATIVLKDSLGNVIATTTATAEKKYSLSIPPSAAKTGVNDFTVTQKIGGTDRDSAQVSLDYGQPAPIVVTSPTDGDTVEKDGLTFTGTGENGAKVIVKGMVNTIASGTVDGTSWTAPVDFALSNNVYKLWAVQTTKGGLTTQQQLTITVSDEALAPLTATAAFNPTNENAPATVSGTAHMDGIVIVKNADGVEIGRATALGGKYSIAIDPKDATFGKNTFTITQVVGGKESLPLTRELDYGNPVAPVITSPLQGATMENGSLRFTGTGQAGADLTIRGMVNPLATGRVASNGWTIDVDRNLTPNVYRLFAVQTSKGGLTKQAEVTITIRDKSVTELTATAKFDDDVTKRATISGNGQNGGTVVVQENGKPITTVKPSNGTYSVEIPATVEGMRTFTVTQTVDGVTSPAKTVVLDYGTVTPLAVTSPTEGEYVDAGNLVFAGTATPGAVVKVGGTTSVLGTATADENGVWTMPITRELTPQVYVLYVKQTTKGGLVSQDVVRTITIK